METAVQIVYVKSASYLLTNGCSKASIHLYGIQDVVSTPTNWIEKDILIFPAACGAKTYFWIHRNISNKLAFAMLIVCNRGSRKLVTNKSCAYRLFSSKPIQNPTVPKRSGGSSFIFLSGVASTAIIGGTAFLSFEMERSEKFASQVEQMSPFLAHFLKPYRSVWKSMVKKDPAPPKVLIAEPVVSQAAKPLQVNNQPPPPPSKAINEGFDAKLLKEAKAAVASYEALIARSKVPPASPVVKAVIPEPSTPINPQKDALITSEKDSSSDSTSHVAKPTPLHTNIVSSSEDIAHQVEAAFLRDVEHMSEVALRVRLAQLAAELADRTKWEGIRLHESLKQAEATLASHYADQLQNERVAHGLETEKLLAQQERELRTEATQKIQEVQDQMDARLHSLIRSQAEGFKASLTSELTAQEERLKKDAAEELALQLARIKEKHVRDSLPIVAEIEILRGQLTAINETIEQAHFLRTESNRIHKMSAAVLALAGALENTSQPISNDVRALKEICAEDNLVRTLLGSLPAHVVEEGVPTIDELKLRFEVVRDEMRKAALAPESAPAYLGQVLGSILSSIMWTPKGYVQGHGIEEILSRVTYLLSFGDLNGALIELSSVKGFPKKLANDWERSVKDRLELEQVTKALKATAAIRHISLVD